MEQYKTGPESQVVPGKGGTNVQETDAGAEYSDYHTSQGDIRIQTGGVDDSLGNTIDANAILYCDTNCGKDTMYTEL